MIAWEPIPHFRAILENLVAINRVGHLVTVRGKVVSAQDGELITMQVRGVRVGREAWARGGKLAPRLAVAASSPAHACRPVSLRPRRCPPRACGARPA